MLVVLFLNEQKVGALSPPVLVGFMSPPVLQQQLGEDGSNHRRVVHTLQEGSELSGPVHVSCVTQNNETIWVNNHQIQASHSSDPALLCFHRPLAETSKEKRSSTTPAPGCCPSDRQNLDTTSRKKELQQFLIALCCWRAALRHKDILLFLLFSL